MTDHDLKPSDAVLSASQALRFLADAGQVLSSSLDYGQTLRRVAQLAVPEFADWCAVFLTDEAGVEEEITSRHPDPELEATLVGIRRRRREVDGASESRRVARTAEPVLAHDVRGAAATDLDAEQRRVLERLAPRSYMLVPMLARGRSIGSLTLLSTRDGPPLHRGGPGLRPDPRRPLRARDRQRPPARRRRALAEPPRHRLRDRPGRAGVRRPRPALRPRQRGDGGLQRPPGRGPRRADDPGGPGRAGRRARAAVPARPRRRACRSTTSSSAARAPPRRTACGTSTSPARRFTAPAATCSA